MHRILDTNINNITNALRAEAETQTSDVVKSALLISGADKRRYGGLNNDLGNNYLLETDQYPDTTEKSRVIMGNYKPARQQQRHKPRDDGGVALIHRGGGDSGGRGHDARGVRSGGTVRGNATNVSTIREEGSIARSNRNGENHFFHYGEEGHWANKCPLLLEEQQSQIQIIIVVEDEAADEGNEDVKKKGGFMVIQVAMLQGKEIPSNRAYLENCSTFTPFKTSKYIRNIKTKKWNAGEMQR